MNSRRTFNYLFGNALLGDRLQRENTGLKLLTQFHLHFQDSLSLLDVLPKWCSGETVSLFLLLKVMQYPLSSE
jgi:hypothetical protein